MNALMAILLLIYTSFSKRLLFNVEQGCPGQRYSSVNAKQTVSIGEIQLYSLPPRNS